MAINNLQLQHLILNTLHIKLKEDFVVITKKLWWKNNKKLIKKRKLIINNVHVRQLVVNNRTNKREIHQNSKIDKATSPIPHIVAPEHSILNEIVNNTLKKRNSRRWSWEFWYFVLSFIISHPLPIQFSEKKWHYQQFRLFINSKSQQYLMIQKIC